MSIRIARRGDLAARRLAVSDTFNRPDSTTTLGMTNTGQTWVPLAATWGINSNKAYLPSPINDSAAFVNGGVSDGVFTCDMTWQDAGDGIMFRALGAAVNDGWLFYLHSNQTAQLLVPGFGSAAINAAQSVVAGTTYHMQVVLIGNNIDVYIDGVQKGSTVTSSNQATATRFGMRSGGSTAGKRWDNFQVA